MDWTDLAEERKKLQAVVKAVMEPSRSTISGKPDRGTQSYVYNIIYDTLKRFCAFVGFVATSNELNEWSKII